MPQRSQLHVSQLLSNISIKYSPADLIWNKVFPQVPVKKDNDLYRVYDRDFRLPETKRAPKGLAREVSFNFSTASYALEQHALKDYIGVDEEENNDLGSLQADSTENLTEIINRRIEYATSQLFVKANWSLNVSLAAGSQFTSNTVTTDPVPVFDTGATTIISNSGKMPNYAIVPRAAMIAMKNHVSILDRLKYTQGKITPELLKGLIEMPEMLVPTNVIDTSNPGQAPTIQQVWNDFCFMGFKPANPGLKTPSAGYTFVNTSVPRTRTWFDNERNATAVEVEIKFQPKVVASLCGYLIGDVL